MPKNLKNCVIRILVAILAAFFYGEPMTPEISNISLMDRKWSTKEVLVVGGAFLAVGAAAVAVYYRYTERPKTIELVVNPAIASVFGSSQESRKEKIKQFGANAVMEVATLITTIRGVHSGIVFCRSLLEIAKTHSASRACAVLATILGSPNVISSGDLTAHGLLTLSEPTVKAEDERLEAWNWLPAVSEGGVELYEILRKKA